MKVYNTLSGQKEPFLEGLPQDSEVKMYVCGINPYADSHIGHALSYIVFDAVRRYLEFRGYRVKHVENVTDVEDNIIATANRLGIPVKELTEKYTQRYLEDMDALNILRAHLYPRATEEIPKIIEIVQGLIDKGYAYPSKGDVYFRVSNVPDYGKLSNRTLESMVAGMRIEPGEGKEHPMDFVLWKAAKPSEPSWASPWGQGRPGWHIECSAMSLKYLGETIDIHGGGQDLVFPHHENEIAQSESFTGKKPFVKYWMHNGLLRLGEAKMSKSLGNLVTIREALAKHSSDALRIFILSSHYRSPLTYSDEALEAAEKGADRLRQAAQSESKGGKAGGSIDIAAYRGKFIEAMDDDFGTGKALSTLFDLAREINSVSEKSADVEKAQNSLKSLAGVLGLTLQKRKGKGSKSKSLVAKQFLELFLINYNWLKEREEWSFDDYLGVIHTERFKSKAFLKLFLLNFQQLSEGGLDLSLLNNYRSIRPTQEHMIEEFLQSIRYYLVNTYNEKIKLSEDWQSLDSRTKSISTESVRTEQWLKLFLFTYDRLREKRQRIPDDYIKVMSTERFKAEPFIRLLVSIREQLRKTRQWNQADKLRDNLEKLGIVLEDSSQGTIWKHQR